ncbi:protein TonB [Saonia flava]|uniref:Protein TonB n=1 Tax=Saonia flava TaxID=523696 RepID=A0A846QZM3_9FLAO|nr:energy transducer TonB [Saonia flava]NJB71115.1 protein TonB [Saonia flava]
MEIKKNPKADLNRDSGLFFVIGLTIVLFLVWRALEMKTYDKEEISLDIVEMVDDIKEDAPITETIKTPPPPPPPSAPEVIEIVEDAAEIEETIISSTETSQDAIIEEVVEVDDVEVEEEEEEISVPFAIIEEVPIFPGCEGLKTNDERKVCFQQKMQEHIKKNFKYPEISIEMGIQGRVIVLFAIDSKGDIVGVRPRGPDKLLENEAVRIVNALPRMIPGRQRGKAVKVPYSIPITFKML